MAKKKKKRIQKKKRKIRVKRGRDGKIEVLLKPGKQVKKRKKSSK